MFTKRFFSNVRLDRWLCFVVFVIFFFVRWKNLLYITSFKWKIDWTQNSLNVRHKTAFYSFSIIRLLLLERHARPNVMLRQTDFSRLKFRCNLFLILACNSIDLHTFAEEAPLSYLHYARTVNNCFYFGLPHHHDIQKIV